MRWLVTTLSLTCCGERHFSYKLALLSGDYLAAVSYYTDPYIGPRTYQKTVVPSGFTGTTECETGMKRKRIRVYVEEHREKGE